MKKKIFTYCFLLLVLSDWSLARTLEEIIESGYIQVAVREKRTVYEKNISSSGNIEYDGLHYHLVTEFAKSIKVTPRFVIITNISQYFVKDVYNKHDLMQKVDLYADNLTVTFNRRRFLEFVNVFKIIEVLIYNKAKVINKLPNLLKLKTSIASGSAYEASIELIEKKLGRSLKVTKVSTTKEQAADLVDGKTDYTILDSDQAAFIVSKNKNLAINIDLLKGISEINSIGWAVEKDNDDLIKEVKQFIKKFVLTKDFRNIWKKTYGIPKKEYDTFIQIVDNQANEILEKGVDYYYKGDYRNSLDALKTSVKFMLYSKKLIKIFDRIYFNLIKKEINTSQATAMILFDEYANFHPLRRTVNQVKRRYKDMYRDYLFSLRSQRDELVDKGHLDKAIDIQKLVVFLEDYAFEEVNLLRILNMKKTLMFKRKEKVTPDDEDNIAMEIPNDPIGDPLQQKNQEVGINNFAQEQNNEINEMLKKKIEPEVEKYEGHRYFKMGVLYYGEQDYENAQEAFKNAIALNYNIEESQKYMSNINEKLTKKASEKLFKQKEEFEYHFKKALNYYFNDRFYEAMEHITTCLDIFPKNKLARKYFELISDRLKLEGEKQVEEISPHYLYYKIKIERADNNIKSGNYLKAKQVLEEVLILFPHNEIAKKKLIVCAFKLDPKEFDSLIPGFYSQATNWFVIGNREQAETQFEFLNQLRPNYLDIKDYLKKIAKEKDSEKKKKKEIKEKKKLPKYDLKKKLSNANSLYNQKKFKNSLTIYNEILKQFPDDYTANLYSSKILNEIEGKKQLQKIVRFTRTTSNRKRAENLYLKGQFFFRIQDYAKTLNYWKKAHSIDPSYQKIAINIQRVEKLLRFQ